MYPGIFPSSLLKILDKTKRIKSFIHFCTHLYNRLAIGFFDYESRVQKICLHLPYINYYQVSVTIGVVELQWSAKGTISFLQQMRLSKYHPSVSAGMYCMERNKTNNSFWNFEMSGSLKVHAPLLNKQLTSSLTKRCPRTRHNWKELPSTI